MKTWTTREIQKLLENNDRAVERAMVTLYQRNTFNSSSREAGTHFALWVLGCNSRGKKVYPPKSLNHPRAVSRYRRFCYIDQKPIDCARAIAIAHAVDLAEAANIKSLQRSEKKVTKPKHIQLTLDDFINSTQPISKPTVKADSSWEDTAELLRSLKDKKSDS